MMHSFPKKAHNHPVFPHHTNTTSNWSIVIVTLGYTFSFYGAPGTPQVLVLAYIGPAQHVKEHVNNSELIEERAGSPGGKGTRRKSSII
jgi:hypothetical protein